MASSSLAIVLLLGCGDGGPIASAPVATIGLEQDSERAFRPLMRAWALGSEKQRQDLDDELKEFIGTHQSDPLVRAALVLRAWNALDHGDLDEARRLVWSRDRPEERSPLRGPGGTWRDAANLVLGAVERLEGRHEAALERLEPLLHKLLDPFAISRLNEELVLAALGAERYADALRFMEVWRSEASPGLERSIEQRAKELLAEVPKAALHADLERRMQQSPSGGGLEMAKLVAQQLAVYAVWDRDSVLARELVDEHGPLLGRYGEAAARLAVDTARGRVLPKTVGVLLSLSSAPMRRRSTDVVAGMTLGLDLPGSGARLVSREAEVGPENVRRALAELAGDGAAVVVAGLDPGHSAEVAGYARDNSIPVVLLTPDPQELWKSSPFVYELGVPPTATVGALSRALASQGRNSPLAVGAPSALAPADGIERSLPCIPLPDAASLRAGADALIVRDGAYCGPKLWEEARAAHLPIAVGLGAAELGELPAGTLVAAAGIFPVQGSSPAPRTQGWFQRKAQPPSWWAALGHDAAVLSLQAVRDLETTDTNADQVRARRLEATSALTVARGQLWSTDATGFDGDQVILRKIRVDRVGDGD